MSLVLSSSQPHYSLFCLMQASELPSDLVGDVAEKESTSEVTVLFNVGVCIL